MECLRCGKKIDEAEARKIEEYSVDPYCNQYCFEVHNGVPLPYGNSTHNWLKWQDIFAQKQIEYENDRAIRS